jgi:flagellin-like protein
LVILSNILINPKGGKKKKMKTLRKIRKNAKALSPVVASIILIAVTVAVSIAVAAWMGALTVGFMGSSSVNINNIQFTDDVGDGSGSDIMVLTLKNTGTKAVTISIAKVNSIAATGTELPLSMDAGEEGVTLTLTGDNAAWTAGNPYKVDLYDGSGQVVGSYQATAPS